MSAADYTELQDSGTRHLRVYCKECGKSTELARLKEHLRSAHLLDSAAVESSYLATLMGVRRTRRARN